MNLPITGYAEIDEQHAILAELIERLRSDRAQMTVCPKVHACTPTRESAKCREHVLFLKNFVTHIADFMLGHTGYEETLMTLLPDVPACREHIDAHRSSHGRINSRLRRLLDDFDRLSPPDIHKTLTEYAMEWLFDGHPDAGNELAAKAADLSQAPLLDAELVSMLDAFVFHNRPTHARYVDIIAKDFSRIKTATRQRYSSMSNMQRLIFAMIAKGKTTPEISELLKISVNTVKTHRSVVFQKMGVSSAIEIVQLAEWFRHDLARHDFE